MPLLPLKGQSFLHRSHFLYITLIQFFHSFMALSPQTHQYLRLIVAASSTQEANDLLAAAMHQNTWKSHHTVSAVRMALAKSQWERAIAITEFCVEKHHIPEPAVYDKLIGALLTRWKHDAAWSAVFRRARKENLRLSPEIVEMLERFVHKDGDRVKVLEEYKQRLGGGNVPK